MSSSNGCALLGTLQQGETASNSTLSRLSALMHRKQERCDRHPRCLVVEHSLPVQRRTIEASCEQQQSVNRKGTWNPQIAEDDSLLDFALISRRD